MILIKKILIKKIEKGQLSIRKIIVEMYAEINTEK